MAYPTSLDSLANPTASDTLASVPHADQHANANDAIEAIEAKLGTGASTPSTAGHALRVTGAGATAFGQVAHGDLGTVGTDDHHAKSHLHDGADGSGTVAHSATTGITANDHHSQSHAVDGVDHTASGLTSGHVMRATAATTFAFGALQDTDIPSTITRDSELSAHEADTTSVHGIADTSLLATQPSYSAWTPALTAATTNPTLGTGSSAQGRYYQSGKHVVAYGSINFGTSGVAEGSGNYIISLPVAMRTPVNNDGNMVGQGYIFDSSTSALRPCIFIRNTDSTVVIRLTTDGSAVTHAAPWTWAASDVLIFHFDYEAA